MIKYLVSIKVGTTTYTWGMEMPPASFRSVCDSFKALVHLRIIDDFVIKDARIDEN